MLAQVVALRREPSRAPADEHGAGASDCCTTDETSALYRNSLPAMHHAVAFVDELPVEQPTKSEPAINMKTAKAHWGS